jgi:hypothetical protein
MHFVLDLCGGVHMVFGEWHWKDSWTPIVFWFPSREEQSGKLLGQSSRVMDWWTFETLQFSLLQAATTLVGGESSRHSILVLEANHLVHVQQLTKPLRVQLPSAWMNERIKLRKRCNSCCCCWFESNLHPSLCVGALSLSLTECFLTF